MALIGTRIRIEGTQEQIEDAIRRLGHVFEVHAHPRFYDSRSDPEIKFAYLRCYARRDSDVLFDQLLAATAVINDLEARNSELSLKNDQLKEEVGLLPKPKPWDAVLSPRLKVEARKH